MGLWGKGLGVSSRESEKEKLQSIFQKKIFYIKGQRIGTETEGKWEMKFCFFLRCNNILHMYAEGNNTVRTGNKLRRNEKKISLVYILGA